MSTPVTLCGCLHTFCLQCLQKWVAVSEACPLCKRRVTAFVSADPGKEQLFTLKQLTASVVQRRERLPGMAEAVEVQKEIYAQRRRRRRAERIRTKSSPTSTVEEGGKDAAGWALAAGALVQQLRAATDDPAALATALADGQRFVAAMDEAGVAAAADTTNATTDYEADPTSRHSSSRGNPTNGSNNRGGGRVIDAVASHRIIQHALGPIPEQTARRTNRHPAPATSSLSQEKGHRHAGHERG